MHKRNSLVDFLAEDQIRALLEYDEEPSSRRYQVHALQSEGTKLVDSTRKFVITGPAGESGFMLLSSSGNPDLVARAVRNIIDIRAKLPDRLAETVLPPVRTGEIDGLSWAIWPRHEPLLARNRLIRRWRLLRNRKMLLNWALEFCHASLTKPRDPAQIATGFEAPLSKVASDNRFPDRVRRQANAGISRLKAGTWQPRHCMQHGDLWAGNFLLSRDRARPAPLFVIDWAGARIMGYPVFDSARLCLSLRCSQRSKSLHLHALAGILECSQSDLQFYALCAIGDLGANLEHFPEDHYVDMGNKVVDYLENAGSA